MWLASGSRQGGMVDGLESVFYAGDTTVSGPPAPLSVRPTLTVVVPYTQNITVTLPTGAGKIISLEVV